MTAPKPIPTGPWVLVVGCHRSGTSAITGALATMGLHGVDPSDRMDDQSSNPEHWESLTASLLNEDLLASQGGAWDAPPTDDAPAPVPDLLHGRDDPAAILRAAYPDPGPAVWKDPRMCLLLPYWQELLPGPLTAIFVWRDPLAVARSLHRRDGISLPAGLALWEQYNRSAADGLQGIDTFVLDYATMVDDPHATIGEVAGWLQGFDRFSPSAEQWDVDRGVAAVDKGLRHESEGTSDGDGDLPTDYRDLADWLAGLAGPHAPFRAEPPPVPPWPEWLIAERREIADLRRTVTAYVEDQNLLHRQIAMLDALVQNREAYLTGERAKYEGARAELDRVRASTSWKVTAPLRVVLARFGRS